MSKSTQTDKIKAIAEKYGYDAQSRQCIEEMSELTQAINKFWRKQLQCGKIDILNIPIGTPEKLNIVEEIADVEICIEQLKHLISCSVDVEKIKAEKISRQIGRIKQAEHTEVYND